MTAAQGWTGWRPHLTSAIGTPETHLTPQETIELAHLRAIEPARAAPADGQPALSLGERLADRIAAEIGSWRFIVLQTLVFAVWIAANAMAWVGAWDPYPFILLNLVLSFQAAYTAPIIMMSQNRQAEVDRLRAMSDHEINRQAALEIKLLHQKLDALAASLEQLQEARLQRL
jgi:uncharacterized membrane protein